MIQNKPGFHCVYRLVILLLISLLLPNASWPADGDQKWAFVTGGRVYSSPAIGPDGTICAGSGDHKLYAINPDGTQKWTFLTDGIVYSSPAIGPDNTIYVGSGDHKVYAINPDGTEKWSFETGNSVESSPAIGADGTIYVGSYDDKLYAINPDGTEKWSLETEGYVYSSPAIGADGTIYVGSWDHKLHAINPDGTEKWSFETGDYMYSSPGIGADGMIYVGSWDHNLYALNSNGTMKWAFVTGGRVHSSPATGTDGTVYVGSGDGKLYAVNPDGTQKWVFETGSRVESSPAIGADGTVYVGAQDGMLHAINPDGTQKWTFETGNWVQSSPAIGADSTIYAGSHDYNLYAIDGSSGGLANSEWPKFRHDVRGTGQWILIPVTTPPAISRNPTSLSNSCQIGQNAASQSFEVWNSGEGTLNYSISDDSTWLSCTPTSGTSTGEYDTITVDYSTSGLMSGTHSAAITISASGASNSPVTIPVTLIVNNQAPTADAGPDQTVGEGDTVVLDGSNSSDPDDGIVSYLWEQIPESIIELSDETAVQPTFVAPDVGPDGESLTFQLTVTDSGGLSSTDTCTAHVTWVNEPPTANAGPDQTVDESDTVVLDGSNSSDPDDGIVSYLWEQIPESIVELSDETAVQPTFVAPDVGPDGESLSFQLTVTDGGGLSSTDTCIVNVTWVNEPPTANAGPDQTVDEGDTVVLNGSDSTDLDDGIASYLWEQIPESIVELSDETAAEPTFVAPEVDSDGESLTFQLTVTDHGGLSSADICIVNVTWANEPPMAIAGPNQTVSEGDTVTLDSSNSTDVDGVIVSYMWTQLIGIPVTLSDTTAAKPTFVAPTVDPGGTELTFQVTVTDDGGLQASDEVFVTVDDNGITGFPDDVITFTSSTGQSMGIKVDSGGSCTSLYAIDPATISDNTNRPEDLIYDLTYIQIKVNTVGGAAVVTIYLPEAAPLGYAWYKYGSNKGWYDYSDHAVFNPGRTEVTLTLMDGDTGDDDGVANGMIVDPSGLGMPPAGPVSPTGGGDSGGGGGGGGGCFIGTAMFGSH
jgi:outer membrane protein assembly factor BamB